MNALGFIVLCGLPGVRIEFNLLSKMPEVWLSQSGGAEIMLAPDLERQVILY